MAARKHTRKRISPKPFFRYALPGVSNGAYLRASGLQLGDATLSPRAFVRASQSREDGTPVRQRNHGGSPMRR